MALYRVVEYWRDKPMFEATRATRPSANRLAYDRVYGHLNVTGGRDTQRGWRMVKTLEDWFRNGMHAEHGDRVSLTDTLYDTRIDVVRVR